MEKVKALKSFSISTHPYFEEGKEYSIEKEKAIELESRGLIKIIKVEKIKIKVENKIIEAKKEIKEIKEEKIEKNIKK